MSELKSSSRDKSLKDCLIEHYDGDNKLLDINLSSEGVEDLQEEGSVSD